MFVVSGIKNKVPWTYVVSDFNGEEITGSFYESQKLVKRNSEEKKYFKEKVINCMSNGKVMINFLTVGFMKKISYKNESIFS